MNSHFEMNGWTDNDLFVQIRMNSMHVNSNHTDSNFEMNGE